MKVVLLRDVVKIGRRGEVVEVPDGYALNMLIPSKSAITANPANIKRFSVARERKEHNVEALQDKLAEAVKGFSITPLVVKVKANEQGHLFQAVSTSLISSEAKASGADIAEEYLVLDVPIKTIGDHEVKIKVAGKDLVLAIKVVSN